MTVSKQKGKQHLSNSYIQLLENWRLAIHLVEGHDIEYINLKYSLYFGFYLLQVVNGIKDNTAAIRDTFQWYHSFLVFMHKFKLFTKEIIGRAVANIQYDQTLVLLRKYLC